MAKLRIKEEGAFHKGIRDLCNKNFKDVSLCTTQLDVTSSTTLVNIVGLVTDALVPGETYKFRAVLPTVCTANNGSKFGFKFGAASMLASIEYEAKAITAAGLAASRGTTATDQALMLDNAAGVVILAEIEGVFILNDTPALRAAYDAGTTTLQLQAAEHTSHADTFSVFKKASLVVDHLATS